MNTEKIEQPQEVLVCFKTHCVNHGVERAGGKVFDLNKVQCNDLRKTLSGNNDWVMVDYNFKNNVILTGDETFDPDKVKDYFEKYTEADLQVAEKVNSVSLKKKEDWPRKTNALALKTSVSKMFINRWNNL